MNSTEKGVTFFCRILTGVLHFYIEKLPRGQYSTGVTSLRYTGVISSEQAKNYVTLGVHVGTVMCNIWQLRGIAP
jgi:hypothetical protein